jgi:D-arabinose 1-dehydrogenase-like Zn-dependent alcohol dehydrogenase
MPYAAVLSGYGSPEALVWSEVTLPAPGPGQIRMRVHAAGVGPTDLKIRRGDLREVFPLPAPAVLGFEAAGTVDALGPGVTGVSLGDEVAAQLPTLGGYGEYALASAWTVKPATVSWADAAALPASAEAAVGVLRQLGVTSGETLLVLGGGGSVGVIATRWPYPRASRSSVPPARATSCSPRISARSRSATDRRSLRRCARTSARWTLSSTPEARAACAALSNSRVAPRA